MPSKGRQMAKQDESILTHPGTQEMTDHVNSYERFTRLFKWGAIVCLIVGVVWLLIVKAYW
jgi:hypothetical protein